MFNNLIFIFLFLKNFNLFNCKKTICEYNLIKLPENSFLFYQRIETKNGIIECLERCIDDWEICKSALFIINNKNKQLCQIYSQNLIINQSSLILTNEQQQQQNNNNNNNTFILLELNDIPCNKKIFEFKLLKFLSHSRREILNLVPSELNKQINKELEKEKIIKLADDPYSSSEIKNEIEINKPIKPIIVSRGLWGQRCRGGFCRFQKNIQNKEKHLPCPALKVTDPCAPQPQWLEWTESSSSICSVSCGNGTIKLKRYCSTGKNKDCKGEETKIQQCIMPSCIIYQWNDWTEWTKPCGEQECPSWSNWNEWGQCSPMSNNCNNEAGIQQRKRDCILNKNERKELIECDGLAFEQRNCYSLINKNCPNWSNWGEWSNCSKKCGNGEKIRYRECINKINKEENCKGPSVEHLLCNTQECPNLNEWSEWSECSNNNCGIVGYQLRSRTCNGSNCIEDVKTENDYRICNNNNNNNCYYFDQWTEWSGCSVTCGQGFCERKRKCLNNNNIENNQKKEFNLNQSFKIGQKEGEEKKKKKRKYFLYLKK
ncbi:hypothetical protein Mgra_00002214 [Meloidogyne graminicola]|uniref:Apple domain-containing protein n=1 Tax=Meloidogyne graminicola TaxID=189291 RepID=A0A8S9ZX59_9BILA|nr:hypothetical protein Mgra_00002214 [Meloidogyne graminicola]